MILSSCSTAPVVISVPTPKTEAPPAELMAKCLDLEPLPSGILVKDLVNQMVKDQAQYKDCKEIHNKLVDLITKRVNTP